MPGSVHPHLVFTLSRPHCSTSITVVNLNVTTDLKEVSGVLAGLQIVALREVAFVPGYVRKTQLVFSNSTPNRNSV